MNVVIAPTDARLLYFIAGLTFSPWASFWIEYGWRLRMSDTSSLGTPMSDAKNEV
jgi:hypothetical protein